MRSKRTAVLRASCFLLCLLFFVCPFPVYAEDDFSPPSTDEAASVFFFHLQSENIAYSKNETEAVSAGSTVKVLAGLVACEALQDRMRETVFITPDMIKPAAGYRMGLEADDMLTVEQLLYAAICGSYNDAFYALACYTSGTLSEFVNEMNARAEELGAHASHFTDPSGIDDASVTTAEDLAKIAKAAYKNPLYMLICGTVKYQMPPTEKMDARTIHNRNALISSSVTTQYYNKNCHGMNAGYTAKGGNCVVAVASKDNESYLCIVLGGEDTEEVNYGYEIANRLIDWAYKTYSYMEVLSPEAVICTIPVTVSELTTSVEVRTQESLTAYLPAGLEIGKDIHYSIRLTHTSLEAPVSEGTFVGYVAVLYDGKVLGTVPLYTAESAERSSFINSLKNIESWTKDRKVRAGLIFFSIGLVSWIAIENILRVRRRRKWNKYFSNKMTLPPMSHPTNSRRKKK